MNPVDMTQVGKIGDFQSVIGVNSQIRGFNIPFRVTVTHGKRDQILICLVGVAHPQPYLVVSLLIPFQEY